MQHGASMGMRGIENYNFGNDRELESRLVPSSLVHCCRDELMIRSCLCTEYVRADPST